MSRAIGAESADSVQMMMEKEELEEKKAHEEEEEDEDDSFWEQMANQPFQDDEDLNVKKNKASDKKKGSEDDDEEDDDAYFNRVQQANQEISDHLFKGDNDIVWSSLLRKHHQLQEQQEPAIQRNYNRGITQPLIEISLAHTELEQHSSSSFSSLFLLQEWLFSFLPSSSKMYNHLNSFINRSNYWLNHPLGEEKFPLTSIMRQSFFVDSLRHPSFILFLRWNMEGEKERNPTPVSNPSVLEAMAFTPLVMPSYAHRDNLKMIHRLVNEFFLLLEKRVFQRPLRANERHSLTFIGTNKTLYEEGFLNSSSLASFATEQQWVEPCNLYSFQNSSMTIFQLTDSEEEFLQKHHLFPDDLSEEDAEIINSSWKYNSATSLHFIHRLIKTGKCLGIRHQNSEGIKEAVSWCLIDSHGGFTMLHTKESFRGKGIARITIKLLMRKMIEKFSFVGVPYCFIVIDNFASQSVFQSLGFQKSEEIVWAGMQFWKRF